MYGDPIVLVCGADDNYVMPLCAMLHSVLENLKKDRHICIYIIDGGVKNKNRDRLSRALKGRHANMQLEWIQPSQDSFSGLKTPKHITKATYLRLHVPHVVPKSFKKAIYLDCDLVVEVSLHHLWNHDLKNRPLLAVQANAEPYIPSEILQPEFDITGVVPNFNAGVMMLNLEYFRREKISSRVLGICREYQIHDQHGLNIVVAGEWGRLDPRWNQLYYLYWFESWPESEFKDQIRSMRQKLLNNPFVIHYTGEDKPWLANCGHPLRDRFRHYLKESGWFSKAGWLMWRNMLTLRNVSRPIRHKIGLHKKSRMYRLWKNLRS